MSNNECTVDFKKLNDQAEESTSLSEQIKSAQALSDQSLAQLILVAADVKRCISGITTDIKFPIDSASIVALQNMISQVHDYNNKRQLARALGMAEENRRSKLSFLKQL